jgi:hypothetical protein
VIRDEDHNPVDCPSVFRAGDKWYMIYVCMNKVGYETHLAVSDDLLNWKPLGKIMSFRKEGWDAWQADGGVALCDPTWGGSSELQTCDGKYWMSYIGGALQGYETDPLAIGMAWTKTPTQMHEWTRIPENPVLSREQPDARQFEKGTLYKSQIIWDKAETLGYPFVMYYNARSGPERIGMAVSKDMVQWKRFGQEPVVAEAKGICDVLFRRLLESHDLRHVRLLEGSRPLDQVDRAEAGGAYGQALGQERRPQALAPEAQRRGLSLLLCLRR